MRTKVGKVLLKLRRIFKIVQVMYMGKPGSAYCMINGDVNSCS